MTAAVALARRRMVRAIDGYGAAFVGIGAWASCYHFIYYDTALAAFPVALLLTDPWRFLRPTLLAAEPVPEELRGYYSPRLLREPPPDATSVPVVPRSAAVLNSMVLTCVALLILIEQGLNNVAIAGSVSIEWLPTSWSIPQPLRFSTTQQGTPWDTFVLLALWVYCGARVLMSSLDSGVKSIH
jgi:arabinofuranan 3-O-arabinosyltransferase